ncbi:hypothetical protein EDC47_11433 [Raoultella planticola]|uniref:hypothetical protein n=1 Tax=Klebsiella/Raoultella group TaxID=2890311 RepID=UPI000665CD49|nr:MULTISPECIES: hypothetical protein [Klebsiella/Raoultella group]TCL46359.1 hypothetical protein EDC47_11433 [Raoultella planticola]SYS38228.1 bacteriophage protein [Klebsiella pneumoniae]HBU7490078.1 hypothetical protein [Klebsiella oxytoca]HBV5299461.1 hypothetical protein [Klebsiella oxytoca]
MSQNWMRHFELQLVGENGQGISLSDFKVTFQIERNDNKWPAVGTVKIYNLSAQTQNRIMQREFSKIIMIAGYDGIAPDVMANEVGIARKISASEVGQVNGTNYGVIFSGDIRFTVNGKDNPVDSWVMVQACDSEEAFTSAFINATISKGYTTEDIYVELMKRLEPYGISRGIVPEFPPTVFPRGRSLLGFVHDYLDEVAEQCKATWQFNYGRIDIVPRDKATHEAVVLNANSGLIGMPEQTIGAGVNVRCLINTKIQLNGLIQLDQASVYRSALSADQVVQAGGPISVESQNGNLVTTGITQSPASIATDGVYKVRYISYTGDTRGQAWYMNLACEARGNTDLFSSSFMNKQSQE